MTPLVCDAPPHHTGSDGGVAVQPARWSGVFAITLCVSALIASEFMPVSWLTPTAVNMGVIEGWAGQCIAALACCLAVTA